MKVSRRSEACKTGDVKSKRRKGDCACKEAGKDAKIKGSTEIVLSS